MKMEKSSTVVSHSFVVLSALALRALLDIDVIEGVTGLIICAGTNGSLMMSKLDESTADAMSSGLLFYCYSLRRLRVFFFRKFVRESDFS